MNRLKLRQRGKALLILLLSLVLFGAVIFTAVRTITPNGSGITAQAKSLELNNPGGTGDIDMRGGTTSVLTGYTPGTTTNGQPFGENGANAKFFHGKVVQWADLAAAADKSAFLRHTTRINALYNGRYANRNWGNKDPVFLEGNNDMTLTDSTNDSGSPPLKIDAYNDEYNNCDTQAAWWVDIEIPDVVGSFTFDVTMSNGDTQAHASKEIKYNFFMIAYSAGTPGRINGVNNDLVASGQSNKYVYIYDNTRVQNQKFDIPRLTVDFAETKFLRIGMFLNGNARWQCCPFIFNFDYTEQNAKTPNFSLNAPATPPSGNASDYVPTSSFGESGTNAVGNYWKTVSWDTLMASTTDTNKAQYLRNGARINGLFNGENSSDFRNSEMRDAPLDDVGRVVDANGDLITSGGSGNGYFSILKIDSNSSRNVEMIWWTDIAVPDNASGSYNFEISMYSPMSTSSTNTKYNFFAIAYSAGGAGRIGGNGELVQLAQANTYATGGGSNTYDIPKLTGINLAKTKLIRVGVYLHGTVGWQHCPVIAKFKVDQNTEPTVSQHITTPVQLKALRDAVNLGFDQAGKDFYLDADLDLGTDWTPIGELTAINYVGANNTAKGIGFAGKFHGNNHKITFSQSNVFATGLFGVVMNGGKVENLAIEGGTLNNSSNSTGNGNGTIASWCFGTIKNVANFGVNLGSSSSDMVKGSSGGIVGYLGVNGSITNAVNFGNIWFTQSSAGSTFRFPDATEISDVLQDAGGIVGVSAGGSITNVANYGNISSTFASAHEAGIAGLLRGGSSVAYAYNYGILYRTGNQAEYAGGIVARCSVGTITIDHAYQGIESASTALTGTTYRSLYATIINTNRGNADYAPAGTATISNCSTNQVGNSTTTTDTTDDWVDTNTWGKDSAINGGGVYLKALHTMLLNLGMVKVTGTVSTDLDRVWTDNGSNFKDSVITKQESWVSTTVKNSYTGGSVTNDSVNPSFESQTIIKDGETVNDIIDPGVYYVSASYSYAGYSFQNIENVVFSLVKMKITSEQDLIVLQKVVNLEGRNQSGSTFTLENDIALTQAWTPIGALKENHYDNTYRNGATSVGFAGTFDGQGHRITNFTQSDVYATGLFGVIKSGGRVMNLAIEGTSVNNGGDTKVSGNGVFASWCFGTLQNVVNFSVDVGTESARVSGSSGGIVGYLGASGVVENAVNFGNVYAASNRDNGASGDGRNLPSTDSTGYYNARGAAGGIVGVTANGTVTNAANYGNVDITGTNSGAGGILGGAYGGTIEYAYNYGNVSAVAYVGGVVMGQEGGNGVTIRYSYQADGTLSANATGKIYQKNACTVIGCPETKPTALDGDFASDKWALDSGINNGGLYLIELHNMLVYTFKMVTGSATVAATANRGKIADGTDWAIGLDPLITVESTATWAAWVPATVKNAYTQGGELKYNKLVITLDEAEVFQIIDAGAYLITNRYGYGSASFVTDGTKIIDEVSLYLYNVKLNIETIDDLKVLRESVNGGIDQNGITFTLEDNLDMSTEDWVAIGALTEENYEKAKNGEVGFAGTFDGQGHILTGFKQTPNSETLVTGLFGVIKSGGRVENLAISGTTYINGIGSWANGNGVIASWCFGTLKNVVNFGVNIGAQTGTNTKALGVTGGIVGYLGAGGSITNAVNFGDIWFEVRVSSDDGKWNLPNVSDSSNRICGGGIVGVSAGTITNVANYGRVNGYGNNVRVGGIAGAMNGGSLSYAYNYGAIYNQSSGYTGGIAACGIDSPITIDYVYNVGIITTSGSTYSSIIPSAVRPTGSQIDFTHCASEKPTTLGGTWEADKFGVDTAIHAGGVYLKELHDLLIGFGMFSVTPSVTAKTTVPVTESYNGTDYAVGLAIKQFNVGTIHWISPAVRKAYTGYPNEEDVPYAKLTIVTSSGETVNEIINAGEYSVSAVYSFGYKLYVEAEEFTFTVKKATGSWSKTEGEYTAAEQEVTFGFGMTLSGVTMAYSYRLQDASEFTQGLPTDAGTYTLRVAVSFPEGFDTNNFETDISGTETEYTVTPKVIEITWTSNIIVGSEGEEILISGTVSEDGAVTTTYNGKAQKPEFTYADESIYGVDAGKVSLVLALAVGGYSAGELINASTTLLTVKATGENAGNYTVSDNPVSFVIKKRVLNVSWEGLTDGKVIHEFDGEYVLPKPVFTDENGDTVKLYTSIGEYAVYQDEGLNFSEGWRNATTEAGEVLTLYVATGEGADWSLSPNYDLQGVSQVVFVIKPKTVTGAWSDVDPKDSSRSLFEYNGKQQAPTFTFDSDMLKGDDAFTVKQLYAYSEKEINSENYNAIGAAPLDAGTYRVTVSLDGKNAGNYVLSESLTEWDFLIAKKQFKLEILPLGPLGDSPGTSTGVSLERNDTDGTVWKVNRKTTKFVYPEVSINLVVPGTKLTLVWYPNDDTSQRKSVTAEPYAQVDGETFTRYQWYLPQEDSVTSVTFWFELPDSIAQNYETEDGEPERQTILLKRTLTYTLSSVEWTYGDGEKVTAPDGKTYYMSTTRGSLEYSEGWTATVDGTVVPYYEFVQGTGDEANIEWMKLAIGKAGTTDVTLTHAESEKYLATEVTVSVKYNRKNVQFNAREVRGSYGEKTYTSEDFFLAPTLAYDDTVATAFTITSDYNSATMKDVHRVDGEVAPYPIEVTIKANPNYTLNGETGDLKLDASLTVLPKALTVYAGTGYTAKYANDLPTIVLTYDGFIDGENIGNIKDEDKDPSFEAPTASFPKSDDGKYLNVGRYDFELTGGQAKNYQFTLIGGTLTITKGDLTGAAGTKENLPYNAMARTYSGTITVFVPKDGTPIQDGYSYTVTRYLQNDVAVSPVNAGTYSVEITVNTAPTDNYDNYVTILEDVFVIDKVTPYLNPTVAEGFIYNGSEQRGVSAECGLTGGTGTGEVKFTYYYENETEETEHPIHAGTYRVTVAYVPGENDNYDDQASTEVSFIIGKASMRISFDGVNTPYDAKTHQIEKLKVAGVGTHGDIYEADITDKVDCTVTYKQGGRVLDVDEYPKNAGMYTVEVVASPRAGAFTYADYEATSLRTESAVVITQVPISEIRFTASTVNYDGTNKEPLNPAVAIGVEGDTPQGTFRYDYRRIGDTIYTAYARSAGKYDVKVTYIPAANDNYTAGKPAEFIGTEDRPFFEILCAPITIRLNRMDINFTGERFPVSAILNSTVAGEEPKGTITYQYYYYEGANKVDMGDTAPRNAGTYGVTVTYEAVTNDNFLGHTEDFKDYIVIRPIAPGISLVGAIHNFDGTPKGANEANLRGGAHDQDGPKQTSLIYMYYVQGSWTSECPTEVGRYQVNVRYKPADGEVNYTETDRTFTDGVIINNRRPTIELETKEAIYDGNPVRPNAAVIGDGTSAKGVIMYEFAQSATWQTGIPVNVGTYSVRVIYRAAADDNYASEVKEFTSALVIKPAELEITPVVGQYKVYDGQPISEIQFNRPQLAPGNLWQGELYAPGVDEGEYEISMGTLTAGKNYNIKFTEGVKYRIEKRTVYFTFADVNPVYDGMYKQVSVSCEGVLDGEDPLCTVLYEGDRMNVGTFKAIATVAGKNYRASANNFREYAITPATMGEIPFADSTVRYDGQPHSILVYSAPDGSKVTYESAHTFTEIGAYIIRAKVTKPNYHDVELRATLVIQKGASRVSVSIPGQTFRYGDALPQLTAIGDPGIATLDEGQVLVPGERDYTWTFTPLDSTHYETVTGTIQIRVIKASADISLHGSLRQEENKTHELVTSVPEQLQGEVKVTYMDAQGNVLMGVPTEAGNYTVRVSYAGDDYYEAFSYDRQLVVTEKSSMMWLLYVVIGVVVLAVASGIFFNTKRKIR